MSNRGRYKPSLESDRYYERHRPKTPPPSRSPKTKDQKTFDEWREKGFRVRKGSKACSFTKSGKPLFAPTQVWKPKDVTRSDPKPIAPPSYLSDTLDGADADVDADDSPPWT